MELLPGVRAQSSVAYCMGGQDLAMLGQFVDAQNCLDLSINHYRIDQDHGLSRSYGEDPCVASKSFSAWCHWFRGDFNTALEVRNEALRLTRWVNHANSTALAVTFDAILKIFLR